MSCEPIYFAGIDLGSSYTKAVILDCDKKIVASSILKSGISFEKIGRKVLKKACKESNLSPQRIACVVATGVGRENCDLAIFSKPEIACFTKGCLSYFYGENAIIVDIGGQDNKVIRISEDGTQLYFKMNRKCAAGTGSFLEDIARKLHISLKRMNLLAQKATKTVPIGSYCTVFAGTEIIHHIRTGKNLHELIRGVFESVVKRVLEMDLLEIKTILTGGVVANNPVIVDIFREKLVHSIILPPNPQTIGALGAAIYAWDDFHAKS
jgi:predicted CoA-substrate-specific enzyme activase